MFERVASRLQTTGARGKNARKPARSIFAGMIKCRYCGGTVTRVSKGRRGYLDRYSGRSGDFVLVVRCLSCGSFEPDSLDECIKVIDDSVVDAVELSSPLVSDSGVGADGVKKTRGERGVDALE